MRRYSCQGSVRAQGCWGASIDALQFVLDDGAPGVAQDQVLHRALGVPMARRGIDQGLAARLVQGRRLEPANRKNKKIKNKK